MNWLKIKYFFCDHAIGIIGTTIMVLALGLAAVFVTKALEWW